MYFYLYCYYCFYESNMTQYYYLHSDPPLRIYITYLIPNTYLNIFPHFHDRLIYISHKTQLKTTIYIRT